MCKSYQGGAKHNDGRENSATGQRVAVKLQETGKVIEALPAALCPATTADGYAIQAELDNGPAARVGWKIAATSVAGQTHIGVDGPLLGRLTSAMMVQQGQPASLWSNRMQVAEAEFVFKFAQTIPPRPTKNQPRGSDEPGF